MAWKPGEPIKFPSPAQVVQTIVPPPPPAFSPPVFQEAYNFLVAPIKSTIAADPLLDWANTGFFRPHGERTAAGVHELYKEDRIVQGLGISEETAVKVVEVAQVIVAIYFGGSFIANYSGEIAAAGEAISEGAAIVGEAGAILATIESVIPQDDTQTDPESVSEMPVDKSMSETLTENAVPVLAILGALAAIIL